MIKDFVKKARTYRTFDETKPVTEEELSAIVDTARFVPAAMNAQPLKYRLISEKAACEALVGMTKWAAKLPELGLPPKGHRPSGFIAVCCDTTIIPREGRWLMFDAGLASEAIVLAASELGYGSCILGSFREDELSSFLSLPETVVPLVLIAVGAPDETVKLTDKQADGSVGYFRDENGVHCVPKRSLEEVVLK